MRLCPFFYFVFLIHLLCQFKKYILYFKLYYKYQYVIQTNPYPLPPPLCQLKKGPQDNLRHFDQHFLAGPVTGSGFCPCGKAEKAFTPMLFFARLATFCIRQNIPGQAGAWPLDPKKGHKKSAVLAQASRRSKKKQRSPLQWAPFCKLGRLASAVGSAQVFPVRCHRGYGGRHQASLTDPFTVLADQKARGDRFCCVGSVTQNMMGIYNKIDAPCHIIGAQGNAIANTQAHAMGQMGTRIILAAKDASCTLRRSPSQRAVQERTCPVAAVNARQLSFFAAPVNMGISHQYFLSSFGMAYVGFGRSVVGLHAVGSKLGHGNGCQNADDRNYDHDLYQGKALGTTKQAFHNALRMLEKVSTLPSGQGLCTTAGDS